MIGNHDDVSTPVSAARTIDCRHWWPNGFVASLPPSERPGVTAADLRSRVSDSTRAGDHQCKDIGCAEAAKARGKRLGPEAMRGPTACDCCQEERRPVLREPFASDPIKAAASNRCGEWRGN